MTTLLNGLVAYYKLDETSGATLSDETGTYPITHSGTTLNQTGKIGKAITINATANNFNIGYLGTNSSINFWHKHNSGTPSLGSIFEIPVTSNRYHQLMINLNTYTNKYYFCSFAQGIGTNYDYAITDAINPNNYNMVTVTWDSSNFYVYINGVYNGTFTKGSAGSCNATNWRMGRNTNQNYDEIGIWNRTLTSDEVKRLYNSGFGLTYPFGIKKYSIFDSCVAYYDFSKNALDVIGENNGTVTGATLTTNHLGQTNSAYSFDGINDEITGTTTDFGTGPFSISGWVKTSVTALSYNQVLMMGYTGSNPDVEVVFYQNGKFLFYIRDSGGSDRNIVTDDAYNDGNWFHFVATRSGANMKLYINNVEVGTSSTGPTGDVMSNGNFVIGNGQSNQNNRWFNGQITNMCFFNKALSVDEVKQLYDLTKNKVIYPIVRGGRE